MRVLAGFFDDYEGAISIDGRRGRHREPRGTRAAKAIALVHQELSLLPEFTVAENIFLGREPRRARSGLGQLLADEPGGRGRARRMRRRPAADREGRKSQHRRAAARRDRQGRALSRRACSFSTSRRLR